LEKKNFVLAYFLKILFSIIRKYWSFYLIITSFFLYLILY